MKLKSLLFALCFTMIGAGSAFAQISGFCFSDGFGYTASTSATRTGPGYYELSGTGDVLLGTDWIITGYYDKETDIWSITYTNPTPDGCGTYVDYFTYTSTSHSAGAINFNWTSYCAFGAVGSGSGSLTFTQGECAFRLGDRTPAGPAYTDEAISSLKLSTPAPTPGVGTFGDYFVEQELSVVNTGNNNFVFSFELATQTSTKVLIYDYSGKYIATIADTQLGEGFYKYTWNGTDASGNEALPGMYLAVLASSDSYVTYKFVK